VVGFGGYPTVPPLLAAAWAGVPGVIHEANAVMRRANRLLAPRVTAIATTFPDMFSQRPDLAAKATLTGNPVRPAVVAAAMTPYPAGGDPLRLLVFGGSQGARVMADGAPAAIEAPDRPTSPRGRSAARARRLWQIVCCCGNGAVFLGSAGAHRRKSSDRGAIGRLDRR